MKTSAILKRVARAPKGIRAIDIGVMVLRSIAERHGSLALRELAVITGLSASLLHRYLASFCATGMVEQDPDTAHYRLGPLALTLGLHRMSALDPVRVATPLLRTLADETGQPVTLAIWGSHGPTVIRWEESSQMISVNLRVGSVLPLLSAATGLVFAAFRPEAANKPWIDQEIKEGRRSGRGPSTRTQSQALIAEVRATGLARVDGTLIPGVSAAAVPVFDHNRQLVLAIASLGYRGVFDISPDGAICSALRRCAAEASRQLGYLPGCDST
jgi:DNA-binding IclR family transcriptional regulator